MTNAAFIKSAPLLLQKQRIQFSAGSNSENQLAVRVRKLYADVLCRISAKRLLELLELQSAFKNDSAPLPADFPKHAFLSREKRKLKMASFYGNIPLALKAHPSLQKQVVDEPQRGKL